MLMIVYAFVYHSKDTKYKLGWQNRAQGILTWSKKSLLHPAIKNGAFEPNIAPSSMRSKLRSHSNISPSKMKMSTKTKENITDRKKTRRIIWNREYIGIIQRFI